MRATLLALAILSGATTAQAETITLEPVTVVEWKAVYGQVETRDRVPARARLSGTISELAVSEGDRVEAGELIARVEDDKLSFELDSIDARIESIRAQLDTAEADRTRGEQLLNNGVITRQRLDQLQTAVDILSGQLRSLQAERLVVEQRQSEGAILAPDAGVVLSVPVSRGSVINAGEPVAIVGSGGVYLRLAIPERHATALSEGDRIELGTGAQVDGNAMSGRLVKLYPQIEGGRVQADVEVDGLEGTFVGRRVPVRLPVGERSALLVPSSALQRDGGLDFVAVTEGGETAHRIVVPGETIARDGMTWVEILSGLKTGDQVVSNNE